MKKITPGIISGNITAPASKSLMQRYVALATVASSESVIKNPSLCNDGLASLEVARALGAMVRTRDDGNINIIPGTPKNPCVLQCEESGTSFRIFSAIAALWSTPITIQATGSLLKRPMNMIEDALKASGVSVTSKNGLPPLVVTGPFTSSTLDIDGSMTSQFLSGLLIALPSLSHSTTVRVSNPTSRPYIEMTLQALKSFLITVEINHSLTEFHIPGNQQPNGQIVKVTGDWSSASFLLVAAATTGSVTLSQLTKDSKQADMAIVDVLKKAGAHVEWLPSGDIFVKKPEEKLKAFEFNATDCPDLFPPLVALAAACDGTSHIIGTSRLTHKESNRAEALISEFSKMGVSVTEKDDALYVVGSAISGGATIHPFGDHRIAMAAAIAALRGDLETTISDPEVVKKSFPDFFEVLGKHSYTM